MSVWLNDKLVVDHAHHGELLRPQVGRSPAKGPIQLQTHGGEIRWRKFSSAKSAPTRRTRSCRAQGDERLQADLQRQGLRRLGRPGREYEVKDGADRLQAQEGRHDLHQGGIADFVARLEFRLPPGGNNGLAIRYPGKGDTAYAGMCEIQVLDDNYEKYAKIDPRQAHGSAYGMVAAQRGYQRPIGEWNFEEVTVRGSTIKVELNGTVILDCDLSKVTDFMANKPHPGKDRTRGNFGFAGHSDPVEFREVAIKKL